MTEKLPNSPFAAPFQSTRPRRGAISSTLNDHPLIACFNPRAPGGARFLKPLLVGWDDIVSIHAPPEGRDRRR